MEKNRTYKIIAFVALFISVLALSVGFATFSSLLEIKGSSKVVAQSWDVHFESLAKTSNMTAKEVTAPEIQPSTTLIQSIDAEFNKPGQVAEYQFDIVNGGSFDAEVAGVTVKTPTCTGNGESATTDATNVCNNITIALTQSDGTPIADGLTLAAGEKLENCKITVTYKATEDKTLLPKDDVKVEGIDASILFQQK